VIAAALAPSSDLIIAAVRATPVNIPLEAPYRWSAGLFPGFTRTIIEVEASNGAVGIGEAGSHHAARLIEDELGPALVGADPYNLGACERRCLPPVRVAMNTEDESSVRAYGGVEMAIWDLIGRLENRSVASLLGGAIRDEVLFTEYFAFRVPTKGRGETTPLEVANYCARMLEEHDARFFEGKVGAVDLTTEIAMVREIRAAIGDEIPLRLDANMAWPTGVAREALRRLEPFNIRSIEEPVSTLEEQARLRASTSIAFSSHDPAIQKVPLLGVPDAFVLNLTALGGIRRMLAFVSACDAFGVDVWSYSPDTGVGTAAFIQVAAAVDALRQPSQTLLRWHQDDVIEGGPMQVKNGGLAVPTGAGLGVSLDPEALQRCHVRFLEHGPYDHYLDPARSHRYGP
jgi:glucarate dehydratase